MVEVARQLNPGIEVVLRTHNEEEAELLRKDGMGTVFLGEHELAKGISAHVIASLGKRGAPGARS
jgi:CPA2 family monovalent cation:H+ antiporter-2